MPEDIISQASQTGTRNTSLGAGTIFSPGAPPSSGYPTFDGIPSGVGIEITDISGVYDTRFDDRGYYSVTG